MTTRATRWTGMSYVLAVPEMLTVAASDVADAGSSLSAGQFGGKSR